MPVVIDSSALLAFLWGEPGGSVVQSALHSGDALCTVVNWAEVATKVMARGGDWQAAETALRGLGLTIVPATDDDAVAAARLWLDHPYLSLGDRICLATALRLNARVVTADRIWAQAIPTVELVRG